jgi:hypothetical protein
MIWHLKDSGVRRPQDLPDHIERRLMFGLSRHAGRIQKIIVFLEDSNGPRGGVDKICRIVVKTRGCGVVITSGMHVNWRLAVDQAAARISRAVARHVVRHRERYRSGSGAAWPNVSPGVN